MQFEGVHICIAEVIESQKSEICDKVGEHGEAEVMFHIWNNAETLLQWKLCELLIVI